MLVWILSVAISSLLILLTGWFLSHILDPKGDDDWPRRLVTSIGLGLTVIVPLGYILTAIVGFSSLGFILTIIGLLGFLILGRVLVNFVYGLRLLPDEGSLAIMTERAWKWLRQNYLRLIFDSFMLIFIGYIAFSLSWAGVGYRTSLPELDPWFWLYNVRHLLLDGTPDYGSVQGYPMGMMFLISAQVFLDPTYNFIYATVRLLPTFLAVLNASIIYLVTRRAFQNTYGPPIISAIAFCVSHNLQFSLRLGRPETIALLLFIITLSYIFIYRSPSPIVSCTFISGVFLYHPLTCAVLLGICVFALFPKIKGRPNREQGYIAIKCAVCVTMLVLPMVLLHAANSDLISKYSFYIETGENITPPEDPLAEAFFWFQYLADRSFGIFFFSIATFEALCILFSDEKNKWRSLAFAFFATWMIFSWIPVSLVGGYARRAATWAVFPMSLLLAQMFDKFELSLISSYQQQLKNRRQPHHLITKFLSFISKPYWMENIRQVIRDPNLSSKIKENLKDRNTPRRITRVIPWRECFSDLKSIRLGRSKIFIFLSIIVISQLSYAQAYTYLGHRWISDNERLTLEWIAENQQDADLVYLYQKHWVVAYSILYPMLVHVDDDFRQAGEAAFDNVFNTNPNWVIFMYQNEPMYQYALNHGWRDLFNAAIAAKYDWGNIFEGSDIHVFNPSITD